MCLSKEKTRAKQKLTDWLQNYYYYFQLTYYRYEMLSNISRYTQIIVPFPLETDSWHRGSYVYPESNAAEG